MESEEEDARSMVSGSQRDSVELLPDHAEDTPSGNINGEVNEEPDQNQFQIRIREGLSLETVRARARW